MSSESGDRPVPRPLHPGAGRRHASPFPKGRIVDPEVLDQIRRLLGDRPRRRDLLIEHLHLIQDQYHRIREDQIVALAEEMSLAPVEVFEVATFYAHFHVIRDADPDPPPITVGVCDGLTCTMFGGEELRKDLDGTLGEAARVTRVPCVGRCESAPVAYVGQHAVDRAAADSVARVVAAGQTGAVVPEYQGFDAFQVEGGYQLLRDCLEGKLDREEMITAVEQAELRGMGGAGFRSGIKWRMVRQQPRPRLMVVNADEGEPGTFKDRYHLEREPHRVLAGMLLAAWVVEADEVYFYLRDEYSQIREILLRELPRLDVEGLTQATKIHLRRGAGAYICGEESAMLESIEGKRGLPRHKPPFPAQVGLFGRPTLIHNVETLYWLQAIVDRGADWFKSQGLNGRHGLRSFSVSGRVKHPGVKTAPAGITVRQLIDEFCGGMAEGHQFHAYLPGGASGGILPAHLGDVPLDFGTLEPYGCFIGSAAVVVLSDQDDVLAAALNLMRFFEDESCGQCTPCRCGTEKARELMEQTVWNEGLLTDLSMVMRDASICGLGQAAPNPLLCVLRYFPAEFESHRR
jgi:NADH:ubiquinone oxidoreductase subunit F (NADH-binding)/NADH:ubiquinone oxidoreductase subunit E